MKVNRALQEARTGMVSPRGPNMSPKSTYSELQKHGMLRFTEPSTKPLTSRPVEAVRETKSYPYWENGNKKQAKGVLTKKHATGAGRKAKAKQHGQTRKKKAQAKSKRGLMGMGYWLVTDNTHINVVFSWALCWLVKYRQHIPLTHLTVLKTDLCIQTKTFWNQAVNMFMLWI